MERPHREPVPQVLEGRGAEEEEEVAVDAKVGEGGEDQEVEVSKGG